MPKSPDRRQQNERSAGERKVTGEPHRLVRSGTEGGIRGRHQRAAYVSGLSHRLRRSGGPRASASASAVAVPKSPNSAL